MNTLRVGLVKGRGNIPEDLKDCCMWGARIKHPLNLLKLDTHAENCARKYRNWGYDGVDLYPTPDPPALIAAINAFMKHGFTVTLFHFNKTTGDYIAQPLKVPTTY